MIPAAAAIVSAVEDALKPFNVRIEETPLCPGTILSRIDASQARNGMLQSHPRDGFESGSASGSRKQT